MDLSPEIPALAAALPIIWKRGGNTSDIRGAFPIVGDSYEEHLALAKGTAAERYLYACDYCYLYPNRKAFEAEALSWDIRSRLGFEWQEVEEETIRRAMPGVASSVGFSVRVKNHGRNSDPGAYTKALATDFESHSGRILIDEVRRLQIKGGGLEGVELSNGRVAAYAVVVAAGAWSKELLMPLGISVPLESERGYHVEYYDPPITLAEPVMFADGKFVITPMEGRLRAAGILEFGGLEAGASEAPFRFLETRVQAVLPGLSYSRTERWMGHRPAIVDSLPMIDEIDSAKGVSMAFGHHHHHVGLTGAAVSQITGATHLRKKAQYRPC
jgi:D-amino-acid dehydrogenase